MRAFKYIKWSKHYDLKLGETYMGVVFRPNLILIYNNGRNEFYRSECFEEVRERESDV